MCRREKMRRKRAGEAKKNMEKERSTSRNNIQLRGLTTSPNFIHILTNVGILTINVILKASKMKVHLPLILYTFACNEAVVVSAPNCKH